VEDADHLLDAALVDGMRVWLDVPIWRRRSSTGVSMSIASIWLRGTMMSSTVIDSRSTRFSSMFWCFCGRKLRFEHEGAQFLERELLRVRIVRGLEAQEPHQRAHEQVHEPDHRVGELEQRREQ